MQGMPRHPAVVPIAAADPNHDERFGLTRSQETCCNRLRMATRLRWFLLAHLIATAFSALAEAPPTINTLLAEGRIRDGLELYASPDSDSERFSLAMLQSLDGLQRFSVGFQGLGVKSELASSGLPFFRVLIPARAPGPAHPTTPAMVHALFADLKSSLLAANATLDTLVGEDFGVEVDLAKVQIDFDGDGQCNPDETLLASVGRPLGLNTAVSPDGLLIRFDSADAVWLKGYTHFLSGVLDLLLAYDWTPLWRHCAHLLFLDPVPAPTMARYTSHHQFADFADGIAAIHDMRLNLVDAEGPRRALAHFQAMISCSRTCWRLILDETDDNHEWLPSPSQTGPGGARVSHAEVQGWVLVLDELDAIATGTKLLPHWRVAPRFGINVEKLVASPPPLDLMLIVQGSALIPYLEEGSVSDQATWTSLTRVFGPGFARFAVWSN